MLCRFKDCQVSWWWVSAHRIYHGIQIFALISQLFLRLKRAEDRRASNIIEQINYSVGPFSIPYKLMEWMQRNDNCTLLISTWKRVFKFQWIRICSCSYKASIPNKGLLNSNEFNLALYPARFETKKAIVKQQKQWDLHFSWLRLTRNWFSYF